MAPPAPAGPVRRHATAYRGRVIEIPQRFRRWVEGRPEWRDWLDSLPGLLTDLVREWGLRPDGPAGSGDCAVVLPVLTDDGRAGALKVGWPHWEAEHEHLALRAWGGRGAVQLWRADPHRYALLMERADAARDLNALPVLAACEVVGGLYARLHVPALPQLRRLSELCTEWADQLPVLTTTQLAPRRLVSQAISLLRRFADDPATDGTLVHTDLHYFNVLAAEREPWLVIDPKPLSGDPCFEIAPLLWNRWSEATAATSVRQALLSRMYAVVDAAGLDEDRVRDWVVARELTNVLWSYQDLQRGTAVRDGWITASTTIAKAVQR